jgi:hypothetical protein
METMRKFKVGDNAVRVSCFTDKSPKGYVTKVLENDLYNDINGIKRDFWSHFWELVPEDIAPKWTIYNNTLTWSDLSDKQKGKLMVAENDGYEIKGFKCTALNKPVRFDCHHITYFAVEPVPVKPEPTMAELFRNDWATCNFGLDANIQEQMIAKGWTKSCK